MSARDVTANETSQRQPHDPAEASRQFTQHLLAIQRLIEGYEEELAELRAWREGRRGVEEFYAEREGRYAALRETERSRREAVNLGVENRALRRMLWLRHGCSAASLYGDDGEMQCATCRLDFGRMTTDELAFAFQQIAAAALDASGSSR